MCMEIDDELVRDIQGRMILHWNYRNLHEIPVELLNHGDHIKEIYLKRNCITRLPVEIGKLGNLTNLYLIGNQISSLPVEIGQLQNLMVLDLSQNLLRNLPPSIGNLSALQHLLITHNQLDALPQELGDLKNLKFLELSGNRILTLSNSVIQGLEALEELAVDGNPITSFPRGIVRLQNLRYVSACKCNLIYLPALPFHTLVNGQRVLGEYTPKTAIPISSNNSVNNDFKLLFDSNPRLNYFPYWVIQLFGTEVDCFGCAINQYCADPDDLEQWGSSADSSQKNRLDSLSTTFSQSMRTSTNGSSRIKLDFKGKRHALHFDEDLMKIHKETTKKPPTLLELCLRAVYDQWVLLQQGHRFQRFKSSRNNTLISAKTKYSVVAETLTRFSNPEDRNQKLCNSNDSDNYSSEMEIEDCGSAAGFPSATIRQNDGKTFSNKRVGTVSSSSCFYDNTDNPFLLPNNLKDILNKGPVTRCFECMRNLFTETWIVVFSIPQSTDGHLHQLLNNQMDQNIRLHKEDSRIQIGCVHFCGERCLTRLRDLINEPDTSLANQNLRFIFKNRINWRRN